MEFYPKNKDYESWIGARWESEADKPVKTEPIAQIETAKPAKTSKPRVRNFTMIENGELISVSMLVSNEVVRIDGMMV